MIKTTMPCRKEKIVIIWWWDAVSSSSRVQMDETGSLKLAQNCNIGWIAQEDDERIVLCHGKSTTGEVDHFLIPKPNIIKRVTVCPRKR